MPKTTNTRKQKAQELLRLAERGPVFSNMTNKEVPNWDDPKDFDSPRSAYVRWSGWIVPLIKELVPELRPKKIKPARKP